MLLVFGTQVVNFGSGQSWDGRSRAVGWRAGSLESNGAWMTSVHGLAGGLLGER